GRRRQGASSFKWCVTLQRASTSLVYMEYDMRRLHRCVIGAQVYSARSIRMMSSSGIRRVADHMVIAAAALKEIARAMDVAKPTGMASGIKLPRELPTAL